MQREDLIPHAHPLWPDAQLRAVAERNRHLGRAPSTHAGLLLPAAVTAPAAAPILAVAHRWRKRYYTPSVAGTRPSHYHSQSSLRRTLMHARTLLYFQQRRESRSVAKAVRRCLSMMARRSRGSLRAGRKRRVWNPTRGWSGIRSSPNTRDRRPRACAAWS